MKSKKTKKYQYLDEQIDEVCYVCNKKIGKNRFYAIGKDKKGKEMYRHLKCSSLNYKRKES